MNKNQLPEWYDESISAMDAAMNAAMNGVYQIIEAIAEKFDDRAGVWLSAKIECALTAALDNYASIDASSAKVVKASRLLNKMELRDRDASVNPSIDEIDAELNILMGGQL